MWISPLAPKSLAPSHGFLCHSRPYVDPRPLLILPGAASSAGWGPGGLLRAQGCGWGHRGSPGGEDTQLSKAMEQALGLQHALGQGYRKPAKWSFGLCAGLSAGSVRGMCGVCAGLSAGSVRGLCRVKCRVCAGSSARRPQLGSEGVALTGPPQGWRIHSAGFSASHLALPRIL